MKSMVLKCWIKEQDRNKLKHVVFKAYEKSENDLKKIQVTL